MNTPTDREARAFRAAYKELVEPAPRAPTWEELMDTAKPRDARVGWAPAYRRPVAIAATSALLIALVIGSLALFGPLGGTETIDVIDEPPVTTTEPITETTAAAPGTTTPTVVPTTTTTVTAAPGLIPALGEGWEIVFSTRPGDTLILEPDLVFPTGAGYYVEVLDVETYENHPYLVRLDDDEPILIESIAAGSPAVGPAHGFVTGGPGVVAWANIGPESQTDAQLWVSSNGISFERVAEGLLAGCEGATDCQGTEIYAAAASPSGRVVALAYDPLVWNADCDCFDLNPVALVSDDGYQWTRQPLDLLSVLPAEWQGAADIRSSLVYVDGRWLTYGTRYYNGGYTIDTAFFASEDGIDWQLIDTGDLFDETQLMGIAANDRGVVAITRGAAYWSGDGYDWTRTTLTDRDHVLSVAAYDDGYIAVSSPIVPDGAPLDTIWYSADGTTWSRMPLQLEDIAWNTIVGDGPNLVAVGPTTNSSAHLTGIWRWSG